VTVIGNTLSIVAATGTLTTRLTAAAGTTVKLPVPFNAEFVVSVTVMVCAPEVFRVTVVWPTPPDSETAPAGTNNGSELLNATLPL
jgi:hypothetical protein